MYWIKRFVILFAIACGLLVRTSSGLRARLQPTERFEFCVARNLSGSPMFDEEDRERMEKIVMETSVRMREMRADPENTSNTKTMLRLFAAALACVVADCDSSLRSERERACITALESCAESLKEPAGADVVKEMKKIFSAMSREITILDEIADNSAPAATKKKELAGKEKGLEHQIREEKMESLKETAKVEKKEHPEKEYEVKNRPKRAYVNTFQYQGSRRPPPQSNPALESIIADKLLKSNTFNNFFTFGLAQEDAVFYSRSMVASGMSNYRYDIIEEAMNAVGAALSRLGSFAGPNDYAYTIGRAIASVISAHELLFYADGLGIGSSLVYQLDSMLGSNPSSTFELSPSFASAPVSSFGSASASSSGTASASNSRSALASSFGSASASNFGTASAPSFGSASASSFGKAPASSSGWVSSGAVASSQSRGMASAQVNPSYVESSFAIPPNPDNDKTQFQNRLSYFLSQSLKISGAFCYGSLPDVFEVINSAFFDYGYSISSTIANVVSNSLNMLPLEAACTQYAEVISEVVAEILHKNGFIQTADPQAITNKISDLISYNSQSNSPQNPSSFGEQTFSGSEYQLDPSFSDYSYFAPENPNFPENQTSDSDISSFVQEAPIQPQSPVLTNFTGFSLEASPSAIQPSSKQELPVELSSDGLVVPGGSPLSPADTAATNNSWVIVDFPSDGKVVPALDKANQTDGTIGMSPPIILEPGPVIPDNISSDVGSAPESKLTTSDKTTMAPEVIKVTEVAEMTTPIPITSNFQLTTAKAQAEVITPAPQVDLKDAFESPSKLSDFLLKEMTSSLKGMNVTSGEDKKQPDFPKAYEYSTDGNVPQTAMNPQTVMNPQTAMAPQLSMAPQPPMVPQTAMDLQTAMNPQTANSPPIVRDSKPTEMTPESQTKPSSIQTSTEVQPSSETSTQQNGPPVGVPLIAPEPITDELTALVFADRVSSIVSSSISVIRSQNFKFDDLCRKLNELAPMVDLPPLDVCSELPLIDYLLHILNAVTYSLAGER